MSAEVLGESHEQAEVPPSPLRQRILDLTSGFSDEPLQEAADPAACDVAAPEVALPGPMEPSVELEEPAGEYVEPAEQSLGERTAGWQRPKASGPALWQSRTYDSTARRRAGTDLVPYDQKPGTALQPHRQRNPVVPPGGQWQPGPGDSIVPGFRRATAITLSVAALAFLVTRGYSEAEKFEHYLHPAEKSTVQPAVSPDASVKPGSATRRSSPASNLSTTTLTLTPQANPFGGLPREFHSGSGDTSNSTDWAVDTNGPGKVIVVAPESTDVVDLPVGEPGQIYVKDGRTVTVEVHETGASGLGAKGMTLTIHK